jgi:hypothetical protein
LADVEDWYSSVQNHHRIELKSVRQLRVERRRKIAVGWRTLREEKE